MADEQTLKLSKSQQLLADAREAAELRAYRTHPDVAALAIERIRTTVAVLVWSGLVLGLLFTMSNVAHFAGADAARWSVPWLIAWLLDPMVSLCLIGVLIAEFTLARYQIEPGPWVRVAKFGLLAATYLMNTWSAWARAGSAPSQVILHSVPPLVVFVMAEAVTDLRSRLTDAVLAAHRYASHALADTDADVDARVWPVAGTDQAPNRSGLADDRTALPEATTAGDPAGWHEGTGSASGEDQPIPDLTDGTSDEQTSGDRTQPLHRGEDHGPRADDATPTNGDRSTPDVTDLLEPGRTVRDRITAGGDTLTRRKLIDGLRADGHAVSTNRASALLRVLTAESSPAPTQYTRDEVSDASRASEAA